MIQLDPLASGVSLVALAISIWAIVVAKRAPLRDRTRATRDLVRAALTTALDGLGELSTAIREGRDLPAFPTSLQIAKGTLSQLAPRLPETTSLLVLESQLSSLEARAASVSAIESSIESSTKTLGFWKERAADNVTASLSEIARTNAARADQAITQSTRSRDANRIELRDKVEEVRKAVKAYIDVHDAHDRAEKDPK